MAIGALAGGLMMKGLNSILRPSKKLFMKDLSNLLKENKLNLEVVLQKDYLFESLRLLLKNNKGVQLDEVGKNNFKNLFIKKLFNYYDDRSVNDKELGELSRIYELYDAIGDLNFKKTVWQGYQTLSSVKQQALSTKHRQLAKEKNMQLKKIFLMFPTYQIYEDLLNDKSFCSDFFQSLFTKNKFKEKSLIELWIGFDAPEYIAKKSNERFEVLSHASSPDPIKRLVKVFLEKNKDQFSFFKAIFCTNSKNNIIEKVFEKNADLKEIDVWSMFRQVNGSPLLKKSIEYNCTVVPLNHELNFLSELKKDYVTFSIQAETEKKSIYKQI